MLQHIRDKTQGWFTTTIISIICVLFVFWGVHSFVGNGGSAPDTVATIDGMAISKSQLNATYNRLREQQQMQLGANFTLTDDVAQKLQQTALQQLVSSEALSTAALAEGLRFTPAQVGAVIAGISAFQDNGHFSPSRFVQAISSLGFSEQGFYDNVRDAMLINQLRVGIVGSNFALPSEIANALHLLNQKRDIHYLVFSVKDYGRQAVIKPADIENYYQQHQDQYKTQEGVELQYLSLDLPTLVANQHLSSDEVKAFYQSNLSNYTIPAKWQLQTVFLGGNSDDPNNATMKKVVAALQHNKNTADIQAIHPGLQIQASYWLSDKELDPAIQAVVSHLADGAVSSPIKTPQGWVVVKLLAKQKAQVQAFDQIKAQVATAAAQQKAQQVFADVAEQLSQLTYTHPGSLSEAAQALGLPLKTTALLNQNSPKTDIWANASVREAAFSPDVLAGNNSSVLTISDNQVVVLRVLKHVPATVLPLTAVSKGIVTTLQQQKAEQLAKADADQLTAAVRTQQGVDALMKAKHWQWTKALAVGHLTPSINGAIVNAAFQLPRPGKMPSANVFRLANGDYAVVQLVAISDAKDSALTPIQQRVMAQQIASGYAQLDYQLYVNGVMNKARISLTNPQQSSAS